MNPADFVYKNALKGALDAGASQSASKNAAQRAMERYKKGKYKKIDQMIKEEIATAKRISK